MKFLRLLVAFTLFYVTPVSGQMDTLDAPYKRFPTLPPIQLLLGDSTTKFAKADLPRNKPVIIMIFSPECSHCQQTARDLPKYKDQLKGTTIVMATMYGYAAMNEFARAYNLASMNNIIVGKDVYFLLPPFYGAKNLPYFAFYDRRGRLLSVFEGSLSLEQMIARSKKVD